MIIEDNDEPLVFGDWNYRMSITFTNYTNHVVQTEIDFPRVDLGAAVAD